MPDLIRATGNGRLAYLACVADFQPRRREYRLPRPSLWRRVVLAVAEGCAWAWGGGR